MRVRDVMSKGVVTIAPNDSLATAITRMVDRHVSGLPVVERAGALVGVLSEGDLLRRVELGTAGAPPWLADMFRPGHQAKVYARTHGYLVDHVMSRTPRTIESDAALPEALRLMEQHRVKRLPVLDRGTLVGIITRADFVKALAGLVAAYYEEPATCDTHLEAAILAELSRHPWASAARIEVSVRDRLAIFAGEITDERQRGALQAAAGSIAGVRGVEVDRLRLDTRADLSEGAIRHAEEW